MFINIISSCYVSELAL